MTHSGRVALISCHCEEVAGRTGSPSCSVLYEACLVQALASYMDGPRLNVVGGTNYDADFFHRTPSIVTDD